MKNIEAIIFDLGGVILNIDYRLTAEAFQQLCPDTRGLETFYSQEKQNPLFDDLEKGNIAAGDFRNKIREYLGKYFTDEVIDNAWNALLLDLPLERLEFLQSLKNKYKLFLLSNTNEIHIKAFSAYLQKLIGKPDMADYFIKEYFSFNLGMRKPEIAIFEAVVNEQSLNTSKTLFIDDSPQHVEGAKKAGLQAIHLKKGESFISLFS